MENNNQQVKKGIVKASDVLKKLKSPVERINFSL